MVVDVEADLDDAGDILAWRHTIWSNGHTSRPGRGKKPALLGAWHLDRPFERRPAINPPFAAGGGAERNAMPLYTFPAWQIVNHWVLAMPLRTSALRSLGAYANVFAIESFLDEVAASAGEDPVAYRLRYLDDPRARTVIERAAAKFGWDNRQKSEGIGQGVGFARYKGGGAYCAVIAEIEAEAEIRVRRLVIAVDAGLVVNPDGIANQIEGGAIQATSWTLKEAVRFDRERVTSDSWQAYPILRCSETPAVDVEIVSRPDCPAVGVGEAAQGLLPGFKPAGLVYEYDPASDAWTQKKPMPHPVHHAAVTVLNGKMYLFGGFDLPSAGPPGWNPVNDAWEYDPATDGWRSLAPMPTARGGGVAAAIGGKFLVIGGAGPMPDASAPVIRPRQPQRSLGTVEQYDPATNAWRARAPMPTPCNHMGGEAVNR